MSERERDGNEQSKLMNQQQQVQPKTEEVLDTMAGSKSLNHPNWIIRY